MVKMGESFIDKAIQAVAPQWGLKRREARIRLKLSDSYDINRRRYSKEYKPTNASANAIISHSVEHLRNVSRDLIRNNPMACGAIKKKKISVIGRGLKLQPRIDYEYLGLTELDADKLEQKIKRSFDYWAMSKGCDASRQSNFYELQKLVYGAVLESGEALVLITGKKTKYEKYRTRLQIIEADRLSNPNYKQNTDTLINGIEYNQDGEPLYYYICDKHPGEVFYSRKVTWKRIPAVNQTTGYRNILHLFKKDRPGQGKGIPDLTPVIETLKKLGDYTQHELEAASISALFTVFLRPETGTGGFGALAPTAAGVNDEILNYELEPGTVVNAPAGSDIDFANPNRPNVNFDPFFIAMVRQIGVALGLPYEILLQHFSSSYSASRAAMLEAWTYFYTERNWMVDNFCAPVYEAFLWESFALKDINAAGFFYDPLVRYAYLGAQWNGDARGQIDELKEAKAAEIFLNKGIKTLDQVTREVTGHNWVENHRQSVKENNARKDAGLVNEQTLTEQSELLEEDKDLND
ncbi:MAG: phage portal protein [Cyanobacteria bacterium P01_H01_bin.74]